MAGRNQVMLIPQDLILYLHYEQKALKDLVQRIIIWTQMACPWTLKLQKSPCVLKAPDFFSLNRCVLSVPEPQSHLLNNKCVPFSIYFSHSRQPPTDSEKEMTNPLTAVQPPVGTKTLIVGLMIYCFLLDVWVAISLSDIWGWRCHLLNLGGLQFPDLLPKLVRLTEPSPSHNHVWTWMRS